VAHIESVDTKAAEKECKQDSGDLIPLGGIRRRQLRVWIHRPDVVVDLDWDLTVLIAGPRALLNQGSLSLIWRLDEGRCALRKYCEQRIQTRHLTSSHHSSIDRIDQVGVGIDAPLLAPLRKGVHVYWTINLTVGADD